MTTQVDDYAWWRDALAGKAPPIHSDAPMCGFFKMRNGKDGPWLPVAIWRGSPGPGGAAYGQLACRVGAATRDANEVWTWAAKNPIANDVAKFAFENGRFPDEPEPLVQRSNMPSDPFAALLAEAEDRCAQADEFLERHPDIKSQTDCDMARNIQAQLLALKAQADAMFETEKRPITESGRKVDEKFRFRASVKVMCDRLRSRFETFLKVEERRLKAEAEAKRQAEIERIEAAQAKLMRDDPIQALTSPPPELPPEPVAPKVQAGGGFGRKSGLRSEWVGEIEDYKAALAHFAEHEDIKAVVAKLVKAAVKAGKGMTKIPGVKITEDRRAA